MADVSVLLDTHALVWWIYDLPQLSSAANEVISDEAHDVFVSAASAWELGTKYRLGRLPGCEELIESFHEKLAEARFRSLSVTAHHAMFAGRIDSSHRDPFDRMIAAQSRLQALPVVTTDAAIAELGAKVIW